MSEEVKEEKKGAKFDLSSTVKELRAEIEELKSKMNPGETTTANSFENRGSHPNQIAR